jgi:hypothetical protein
MQARHRRDRSGITSNLKSIFQVADLPGFGAMYTARLSYFCRGSKTPILSGASSRGLRSVRVSATSVYGCTLFVCSTQSSPSDPPRPRPIWLMELESVPDWEYAQNTAVMMMHSCMQHLVIPQAKPMNCMQHLVINLITHPAHADLADGARVGARLGIRAEYGTPCLRHLRQAL